MLECLFYCRQSIFNIDITAQLTGIIVLSMTAQVLVHPCQIEVLLHLRHPNASSSLHWAQFGLHFFKCWISVLKISVEKKLLRAFKKAYFLVLLFNKRTVLEGIRIVFLQLFLQACTKIPILPDYNRHVDCFSSGIKRRKKNNLKK